MNRDDIIDDDLWDGFSAISAGGVLGEQVASKVNAMIEKLILEGEALPVCGFDDSYYTSGGTTTTDPFYNLTADQLLAQMTEAKAKFDELRRQELRSFSSAIEQIGPCRRCGHKIMLRNQCGDAIVLCQTVYRALVSDARFIEANAATPAIGRLRLEPFPCEPRAPLQ